MECISGCVWGFARVLYFVWGAYDHKPPENSNDGAPPFSLQHPILDQPSEEHIVGIHAHAHSLVQEVANATQPGLVVLGVPPGGRVSPEVACSAQSVLATSESLSCDSRRRGLQNKGVKRWVL